MNKFSKISVPLFIGVLVLIIFLATKPVLVSRENSIEIKAVVTRVSEGGMEDIVISLENVRGVHYINRGIEQGFTVDELNRRLINREVKVSYAKPRALNLLSPMTGTRHITELRLGDEVVYSELIN